MKRVFESSLLLISITILLLSFIVSPFRDELDLIEKQVSENGLLVQRLIFTLIILLSLAYYLIKGFKFKVLQFLNLIIGLYAIVKLNLSFFV